MDSVHRTHCMQRSVHAACNALQWGPASCIAFLSIGFLSQVLQLSFFLVCALVMDGQERIKKYASGRMRRMLLIASSSQYSQLTCEL